MLFIILCSKTDLLVRRAAGKRMLPMANSPPKCILINSEQTIDE